MKEYTNFQSSWKQASIVKRCNKSLNQSNKSPICGEIMFSVQLNPIYATEVNPEAMIAILGINDTNETHQVTEVCAWLVKKYLESCSAKILSKINAKKILWLCVWNRVFRTTSKANSVQKPTPSVAPQNQSQTSSYRPINSRNHSAQSK